MRLGRVVAPIVALCLSVDPRGAEAAAGQAAFAATRRLQVKGCGRTTQEVSAALTVREDGGWSLSLDGVVLVGTYVAGGRGKRTLSLAPDAASTAALAAGVRDQV